ncbi:MAG: hypothetical protein AAGC83_05175 [Pseudomonadota bacterium]
MANKSWAEKFGAAKEAEIKLVPTDMVGMKEGEKMLLPTPQLIDDFVRSIPPGQSVDTKEMRRALAASQNAEVTCPIVTGIHLRTVAEVAYERHQMGAPLSDVTPFWRVVRARQPLAKKLSCGISFVAKQRESEGLEA